MPTQEQIDAANEYLAQVNKQVNDGLVAVNQIKLEQEGAQAGLSRLTDAVKKAQDDLDALNGNLDTVSVARSNKLSEIADIESKISGAKALLETTLAANDVAAAAGVQATVNVKADQDKLIADAQAVIDGFLSQKTDAEKDINILSDQASRLTNQVTTLNAEIVTLNGQVKTATDTLAGLNTQVANAEQAVADLQQKSDSLNTDIVAKTGQSVSLDTDILAKTSQVSDLDQAIADLKIELAKNSLDNVDFLKARANVVELQKTNEQRTELLKQKYGDLGEPFN